MKQVEFKEWLQLKFPDSSATVNNRISNCKNIEKYYGNLDDQFNIDKCKSIIDSLNYTSEDEREKRPQKHLIAINGNIKMGSATLKLAANLYVEFRESLSAIKEIIPEYDQTTLTLNSVDNKILEDIISLIGNFKYRKHIHADIGFLQIELTEFLNIEYTTFQWKNEYKPSLLVKDSIDIIGESLTSDIKIVIELDTHRADQVAKKFLSRSALMLNENLIYFSVCYPGTKKMNIAECQKYFEYCKLISTSLNNHLGKSKLYAGLILK